MAWTGKLNAAWHRHQLTQAPGGCGKCSLAGGAHLLMLLHGGIELLGKIIGNVGHPRFFLVGPAQSALVLARLFIILLFGVFAVSVGCL